MTTQKLCAIYTRVSTKDQDIGPQLNDLKPYAVSRSFQLYKTYTDQGISGTEPSRPALDSLMQDARKRKFDCVLVWRFDRLARNTKHLINTLHELKHLDIDLISYCENIDTSSPLGEAMFTMISAMAQLESDIISERIKSGLRQAVKNGTVLGRPESNLETDRILQLRNQGLSIRKIAHLLETPKSTIHDYIKHKSEKPTPISANF